MNTGEHDFEETYGRMPEMLIAGVVRNHMTLHGLPGMLVNRILITVVITCLAVTLQGATTSGCFLIVALGAALWAVEGWRQYGESH